jgi:hypothetical protein
MLAAALLALWATDAAMPPRDDDLSMRRIAPLVRRRCACKQTPARADALRFI